MKRTLAARAGLLTGATAAVAVFVAGVVALPLVRGAAEAQAQVALASQADLVRDIATQPHDFDVDGDTHLGGTGNSQGAARALVGIVSYLRVQGVQVQAVVPGTTAPSEMTAAQVERVHQGASVSSKNCSHTRCIFLEARPVGIGTGIALVQPLSVVSAVTTTAATRIGLALIIGFVIALLVGVYAARRLARPLKQAAAAAHRLAEGQRDVLLDPVGPAEVSEIAVALNTLNQQLVHSEGRQREFFLAVSHELRTPLTAIRGYAEAIEDDLVTSDDLSRVGGVMVSESARLDRLVSDLLDLARLGAVDFHVDIQDVNMRGLVADAGDVWSLRAAREGVTFSIEIPQSPVVVSTDPLRARQLIDNLAENALRVTPAGAPMVLALDDTGVVEVRDGGPGLSSDDVQVAFEPGELYQRYKGVRRVGTGFGLALVGRLASRLGVVASAGEAPEGGACFRLEFPLSISTVD